MDVRSASVVPTAVNRVRTLRLRVAWLVKATLVRRTGLLVIFVSALCTPARATPARLTLTDGSVVSGEIESVQDGIYRLRSPSLGTLSVKESEIQRIEMSTDSPARPDSQTALPGAATTPRVDALQRRIVGDEALMTSVTALLDDPQFQAILKDPEIMDALRVGDVDALERNPRFQGLIDNPRVREITKHLAQ